MTQRHKHADLIKAWADGAEIQFRVPPCKEWSNHGKGESPSWNIEIEYRVKPEPKPDVIRYAAMPFPVTSSANPNQFQTVSVQYTNIETVLDNVKLTFDGETRRLKAVELV